MPSKPGWKSGRLNRLTQWADNQTPNRPIICEYDPRGRWLWTKWSGTVLKSVWRSVLCAMLAALGLDLLARHYLSATSWPWYAVPVATDPLIQLLSGANKAWQFHLTLGTFVLTFFTSQAFAYWQTVYSTTRAVQGRINDFCLLLTLGAKREDIEHTKSKDSEKQSKSSSSSGSLFAGFQSVNGANSSEKELTQTRYDPKARELIKTCMRLIRMSHIFFWAMTPTTSNGLSDSERFLVEAANCPLPVDDDGYIGPLLMSPFGLKALVNTGQLTKEEASCLCNTGLPPSQYAFVLLTWVGLHSMNGIQEKTLRGGTGYEGNLLNQLTQLRASMFDIDDLRAGRMPLAYVQLVQVLVDSLVFVSPFALYPELGSLSVPLVGLLALFFRGLLALSKSFLDPFGVEGYEDQCLNVDVLASEINFGASKRWIQAAGVLPKVKAC